jgi:hypothetical protein
MRTWLVPAFRSVLLCSLAVTLPALSQNQQPRPDSRPDSKPDSRPAPRPAPDKPSVRPQPDKRPNPGGPGRPQPSKPNRPNPGNGNNRPQPPRPQPHPKPPVRPNPGGNPGTRPPHRPPSHRPPSHRPPQWGKPPQNRPSYGFRPKDRDYLRRYYRHRFGYINRSRRPIFRIGGFFPYGDISYLSPLPPDVYAYLAPPPPGYQVGYFDGYVVVYDPVTYFIANVIDLLQ